MVPRVFHHTQGFPPHPAFSTRPRVFHTPYPGTPYPVPRPRVFHLAKLQRLLPFWNTDQNMRCKIPLTKIVNWIAGCEM